VSRAISLPEPAEDQVAAVWALVGAREPEELGAAADDVVLALVPEDDVVAAVALDVVVAVRARGAGTAELIARRVHDEVAGGVAARANE